MNEDIKNIKCKNGQLKRFLSCSPNSNMYITMQLYKLQEVQIRNPNQIIMGSQSFNQSQHRQKYFELLEFLI